MAEAKCTQAAGKMDVREVEWTTATPDGDKGWALVGTGSDSGKAVQLQCKVNSNGTVTDIGTGRP